MILKQKREQRLAVRQSCVQLQTQLHVALGKWLNLLKPHFSLLSIGDDTDLKGLCED